jgi:hypothetical protein
MLIVAAHIQNTMLRARGQSQARIDCQIFKNRVVFLQLVHESLPAKSDIMRMKPRGAVFPAIGEKQASSRSDHFRVQNPDGLPLPAFQVRVLSEIPLRLLHQPYVRTWDMTTSGTGDLNMAS